VGWGKGDLLPPQVPVGVEEGWLTSYYLPSHSWVGMKEAHSFPRTLVGWRKVSYPLLSPVGLDEGGPPPPQAPGG